MLYAMPSITAIYAVLLSLLFCWLSLRTIRTRRRLGIGIGDAQNESMTRAMRAHANFAEYVPMVLMLLLLAEWQQVWSIIAHALGMSLLLGRLLHAYGIQQQPENYRFRVTGMAFTFTALISAIITNVVLLLIGWIS